MTVQLEDFIKNTKLPAFLSNHEVLHRFDKIDKVFPGLGLPNSKEDIVLDNTNFVKASALNLVYTIVAVLEEPTRLLNNYGAYFSTRKFLPEKVEEIRNYGIILGNLYRYLGLYTNYEKMIRNDNGKLSIKLSQDIVDFNQRVVFKTDESLFKVYNKVYERLAELKCGVRIGKLDSMEEFKRFSSDNLPSDRFQIVFSSDGVDGLWDIATMSQRGIASCQSWKGQYKNNLVGSIVDPFVGIIYLTSGAKLNDLGTKMVKRCIVKFVVNAETKKPFFMIDRMYPEFDKEIVDKFIDYIKRHTNNKFDVEFGPSMGYKLVNQTYIPSSKVHEKLTQHTRSYRDTRIAYKKELTPEITTFEKNLVAKERKFRNMLRNTSFAATQQIRSSDLEFKNGNVKTTVIGLLNSVDFKHFVRDYYLAVANKVIATGTKKDDVLTSKEYLRRILFHYMKNRHTVAKSEMISLVKKINEYFGDNITAKVNSKIMSVVLEPVQKSIDVKIKYELKKLLDKKPSAVKLPN